MDIGELPPKSASWNYSGLGPRSHRECFREVSTNLIHRYIEDLLFPVAPGLDVFYFEHDSKLTSSPSDLPLVPCTLPSSPLLPLHPAHNHHPVTSPPNLLLLHGTQTSLYPIPLFSSSTHRLPTRSDLLGHQNRQTCRQTCRQLLAHAHSRESAWPGLRGVGSCLGLGRGGVLDLCSGHGRSGWA